MTPRSLVACGWVLVAALPLAAQSPVAGIVFLDANGNGRHDPGERGLGGVAVSNQRTVAVTDAQGAFQLDGPGSGIAFVSVPDGYRAVGAFWRAASSEPLSFPLSPTPRTRSFSFLHASDPHLQPSSVARLERVGRIADSLGVDFVLMTGDLVRDALRVPEAEATAYFELYLQTTGRFATPVWNAPGNHDVFGIERHLSLVSPDNPLYAREMYHHFLGPDYYSFTHGGIHFVALNTVDHDDLWYYGHVDSVQVAWLRQDLAHVPADMPVVTFNHIPFFSTGDVIFGYREDPPAPSVIRVGGKSQYRHTVSNAIEVLAILQTHPCPLALGGHFHIHEQITYALAGSQTRFEQAAAVTGPSDAGPLLFPSGVTLYRVHEGAVAEGEFIPLGAP